MSLIPDDKSPPPQLPEVVEITSWGIRVFPGLIDGKTPVLARWPELATTDSVITSGWWAKKPFNICMVMGRITSGPLAGKYLAGFDYDMKGGQRGGEALLAHDLAGWGNTLTIHTASGGVHKIYWSDEPIANSTGRVAPNVDVRGERGYLIAATSIVGGKPYWREGGYADIKQIPPGLAKLAGKGRKSRANGANGTANGAAHEQGKAPVGDLDQPAAVERTRQYLINEAPEAIQGNHGDQTTFMVACQCKDYGLSEAETLELMLAYWNEEKAIEPWTPDELAVKVANAFRYGQNPPGSADPANEFPVEKSEGDTPQDPKPPAGLFRISYRDRVARAGKTHGNPLIKGLLKRGTVNVMYGPSNSGKTFVAMDMSFAIGTGQPWNGRKTSQGLVVYVAAEGGAGINERTKALDMMRKPEVDPLFDVVPCPIDLLRGSGPESHTSKLIALIKDAEREHGVPCALVVIDTLSRALAGGEENSSVDMGTFIKHIDQIKFATGAAILIIHHSGKDIARGARGWSGVLAAIDTEMELFENTFTNTKQRDLARIENLSFQLEAVEVGVDEDGDPIYSCVMTWGAANDFELPLSPSEKQLFDVLMACPLKTFNQGELRTWLASSGIETRAAIMALKEDVLRERLAVLETKRQGHVWKDGRGRWGLSTKTATVTEEKDR